MARRLSGSVGAAVLAAMTGMVLSAPSRAQAAADGDVTLVIASMGSATSRADAVELLVPVTATGATMDQARAALQPQVDRFQAALRSAGISPDAIRKQDAGTPFGFIGNARLGDDEDALEEEITALAAIRSAVKPRVQSLFRVTVGNEAQLEAVLARLAEAGMRPGMPPIAVQRDKAAARRAAMDDAVAEVRREAEVVAASLNLRLLRIVAVQNSCNPQAVTLAVDDLSSLLQQMQGNEVWSVSTRACVTISFAAQPMRDGTMR